MRDRSAGRLRLGVVAAALACGAVPTAVHAQSLEEALTGAYTNNPQLLAERALLRATDEEVPQALANWRPTVEISASAGRARVDTKQNCTAFTCSPGLPSPGNFGQNLSQQNYGLTLSQPVFRGGRTLAQSEQALSEVRAERARLVSTEETVLLSAVTDYMNVVQSQAVVDLNTNNEQVLRRQLEAAQDRFHVGEVTRTDVAQAEAAYAQAIAGRQSAEGALQVQRVAFERDIGLLPGKLAAPTRSPQLPTDRGAAVDLATAANPNVIAAQFAEEAAEQNVDVVRGQLLPTVSIDATIERNKEALETGQQIDTAQVLAQVSMPLYEGGSIYSQSRQAQQIVAQRKSQLDDARRGAVQAAGQAWEQLQSVRATLVSLESQIKANEIALDGVQQEASVGSRTVLDILNAEQVLFQSRVTLVQSQRDEVVAEFTLASALGRLTAKNLGLPVEFYDPDKNFETVRDKWIGFGTAE